MSNQELLSWDFVEEFTLHQIACLIAGLNPLKIEVNDSRVKHIHDRLLRSHRAGLDWATQQVLKRPLEFHKPEQVLLSLDAARFLSINEVKTKPFKDDELKILAKRLLDRGVNPNYLLVDLFDRKIVDFWLKGNGLESEYEFDLFKDKTDQVELKLPLLDEAKKTLSKEQKQAIAQRQMSLYASNKTKVAKSIGIDRKTLRDWLAWPNTSEPKESIKSRSKKKPDTYTLSTVNWVSNANKA